MSKYEVIKLIMQSTRINEDDKVYAIEMFLKGYYTEQNIEWIWIKPQVTHTTTAKSLFERIENATTTTELAQVIADAKKQRGNLTCVEYYDIEAEANRKKVRLLTR